MRSIPWFGVVEVESFFGARRVKSRRGANGKTAVFGIFERQGQTYPEIVPDCLRPTLKGIIRGRVDSSTVINFDGWRSYDGLVNLGYGHIQVDHSTNEFSKRRRRYRQHRRLPRLGKGRICVAWHVREARPLPPGQDVLERVAEQPKARGKFHP